MLKNIYFWLAAIWTILIGVLCLASFSDLPTVNLKNTDKYVHFTFHFVFTTLWILYLIYKKESPINIKIYGIVFLTSLFYGIGIEFAQDYFTVTRKADILDVCANATGSIIAIIVIIFYKKNLAQK